jgi:putative membrane protein
LTRACSEFTGSTVSASLRQQNFGEARVLEYLSTLPNFLVCLAAGIVLLFAFIAAYVFVTPQHELPLIRQGNVSASVVFGGTLLGFALPLASAVAHSVNVIDLAVWGVVAGVVQAVASLLLRFMIHDLRGHIEADRVSVAITMASLKLAMGLLNAAAIVY